MRSEAKLVAPKLHDQPQLPLAEERFDNADDARAAADREPFTDLERLLAAQVPGRTTSSPRRSS